MSNAAAQTTEPQKGKEPPKAAETLPKIDENTVILTPEGVEGEAALAWLSQRYPEIFPSSPQADEVLRVELDTVELTKRTCVYVLCRKRVNERIPLKDALAWEQSKDGQRVTIHTPVEELAKECRLFGPINCSDYFESSGEKWQAPRLKTSAFLSALSAIARPWAVASPYVAEYKLGQTPTRYRLRNC